MNQQWDAVSRAALQNAAELGARNLQTARGCAARLIHGRSIAVDQRLKTRAQQLDNPVRICFEQGIDFHKLPANRYAEHCHNNQRRA